LRPAQAGTTHYLSVPAAAADCGELLTLTHNRYAFIALAETVRVLDVHAAVRHVVIARLHQGECAARPLIVPEAIAGELDDAVISKLFELGVEFGRLGADTLALRALPIVIGDVDSKAFAEDLLDRLAQGLDRSTAISAAGATAFRTPAGRLERNRWFANISRQLLEFGIAYDAISVTLDPATLIDLLPDSVP
jgi:DNA mismatch repair ATPase MutL